jgi:hypothetical protein
VFSWRFKDLFLSENLSGLKFFDSQTALIHLKNEKIRHSIACFEDHFIDRMCLSGEIAKVDIIKHKKP